MITGSGLNRPVAWVEADELQPGDVLLGPDGVTCRWMLCDLSDPGSAVVYELDTAVNDNFVVTTTRRAPTPSSTTASSMSRAEGLIGDVRNHPEVGRNRTAGGGSGSVNG